MSTAMQNFYKTRYAALSNPAPSPTSLRSAFKFVGASLASGGVYEYPIINGRAFQSVTRSVGNAGSVALRTPVQTSTAKAQVTAPDMHDSCRVTADDIMRGAENPDGSYVSPADFEVQQMLERFGLSVDFDFLYGCGTGAASTSRSYGTIGTAGTAALNSGTCVIRVATSEFSEGLFQAFVGGRLDIYQSDGTTLRANEVMLVAVSDGSTNSLRVDSTADTTTGAGATPQVGDILVPAGAKGKSMVGVAGLLANSSSIFGVDPATVPTFRAKSYAVGGTPLTVAKFFAGCSRHAAVAGDGGEFSLWVPPGTFSDLVLEREALVRTTSTEEIQVGNTMGIKVNAPCGMVRIIQSSLVKQGYAYMICESGKETESANAVMVGSQEPGLAGAGNSQGNVWTQVTGTTSQEAVAHCSIAPLLRDPSKHMFFSGIVPSNATLGS